MAEYINDSIFGKLGYFHNWEDNREMEFCGINTSIMLYIDG